MARIQRMSAESPLTGCTGQMGWTCYGTRLAQTPGSSIAWTSGRKLMALKLSRDTAGPELQMAAAVKLYELGRLSSDAAANLAGVPRTVFLDVRTPAGRFFPALTVRAAGSRCCGT